MPIDPASLNELLGNTGVYIQLARFFLVLLIGILITRTVLVPFVRRIARRRDADKKAKHSMENIIHILGVFAAFTAALQAGEFGSLVTVIGTVAAAATVAIGWGMRDQVGSLVSGVFMHLYPSFVKGDHIQVGDVKGTIREITLSETRLRGENGEKLVVPNNFFTTRPVQNKTKGTITQDDFNVNVRPEKLDEAENTLKRIADGLDAILSRPEPRVVHTDMDANAVTTELLYFVRDTEDIRKIKSEMIQRFNAEAQKQNFLAEPAEDAEDAIDQS